MLQLLCLPQTNNMFRFSGESLLTQNLNSTNDLSLNQLLIQMNNFFLISIFSLLKLISKLVPYQKLKDSSHLSPMTDKDLLQLNLLVTLYLHLLLFVQITPENNLLPGLENFLLKENYFHSSKLINRFTLNIKGLKLEEDILFPL